MSLEEAARYVFSRDQADPPMTPAPQEPSADEPALNLSGREREVMVLVAQGFTNRQISTELGISERTAGNHVGRILGKLGLRSRAQIASWAIEHGLLTPDPE
jgi:DNA-binding NarL/FixJ family response regulator